MSLVLDCSASPTVNQRWPGRGSQVEGTSPPYLPANKDPRRVHYPDPLDRVNTRIIKAGGCMSGVLERPELWRSSLVV